MSWLQTAKEVAELVQKADNIDLMRKVLQLQNEMVEMHDQLTKLREENADLKQRRLTADALRFRDGWYFLQKSDHEEGPFCATCWDDREKLIHAIVTNDLAYCNVCTRSGSEPKVLPRRTIRAE